MGYNVGTKIPPPPKLTLSPTLSGNTVRTTNSVQKLYIILEKLKKLLEEIQ